MANQAAHIIEKQVLEITFQDRKEGMDLPGIMAELTKEKLLPVLEKVMDRLHLEDYVIKLHTLQVDVGELSSGNWEQELVEKAGKQFERELREKLDASTSGIGSNPATKTAAGVQVLSRQDATWSTFVYFLKNGLLPGGSQVVSLKELEEELKGLLPKGEYASQSKQLNELLLHHEKALERFLLQFSDELSDVALSAFGYNQSIKSHELLKHKFLSVKQHHILDFCSSLQAAVRQNAPAPEKLIEKVLEGEQKQISSSAPGSKLTGIDLVDEKETDVCYIRNAGLVILHPFLQNLFLTLAYVDSKQEWVSEEAHQRAVLLSQYLVTGEEEIPEYELLLNKILCGYPLEKSLEDKLELTPAEEEEAAQLMAAVVLHWKALKSTSVSVLRHTFLSRNGKLSRTDKGWLLQVEHQTWDVLMDRLPWGIGMIKNPFMPEWLYVEWV